MVKVHLDTDFGGDPDDACALALLLGWPGVELTGVTTNLDDHGERAGAVRYVLDLVRRSVPVVAGASRTVTDPDKRWPSTVGDERYWPEPIEAVPSEPDTALDALDTAIATGATIVTIGALTNLARLEAARPGRLAAARVVVMGGWLAPLAEGLPQWGPERDFNLQCDPLAASTVLRAVGDLTLATLPALAVAHLRRRDTARLRAAGRIGALLAGQAEAYADEQDRAALTAVHPALPDDLLNFHWDPVTCAIAVGWDAVDITDSNVAIDLAADGTVRMRHDDANGRPVRAVVAIDGVAFSETWLAVVDGLP